MRGWLPGCREHRKLQEAVVLRAQGGEHSTPGSIAAEGWAPAWEHKVIWLCCRPGDLGHAAPRPVDLSDVSKTWLQRWQPMSGPHRCSASKVCTARNQVILSW